MGILTLLLLAKLKITNFKATFVFGSSCENAFYLAQIESLGAVI
jgi:hypothetical protein